jgi:hypothetical protein
VSDVTEVRVRAGELGGLNELVAGAPGPLVWLLDEGAVPEAEARDALLVHAPGPAASLPVDAAGGVVVSLLGRVSESGAPAILESVARHRLPLRHAPITSLLVERETVLGLAPPDPQRFGPYAGSEWTARLFTARPGWLVPASRVTVTSVPRGSVRYALGTARAAGWRRGETLREVARSVSGRRS